MLWQGAGGVGAAAQVLAACQAWKQRQAADPSPEYTTQSSYRLRANRTAASSV